MWTKIRNKIKILHKTSTPNQGSLRLHSMIRRFSEAGRCSLREPEFKSDYGDESCSRGCCKKRLVEFIRICCVEHYRLQHHEGLRRGNGGLGRRGSGSPTTTGYVGTTTVATALRAACNGVPNKRLHTRRGNAVWFWIGGTRVRKTSICHFPIATYFALKA